MSTDCIHAKVRGKDAIRLKPYTWPIRVNLNSMKEVMSLWMVKKEGAKFWLHLVTEQKNRGVRDTFIACLNALKKFLQCYAGVISQDCRTAMPCEKGCLIV